MMRAYVVDGALCAERIAFAGYARLLRSAVTDVTLSIWLVSSSTPLSEWNGEQAEPDTQKLKACTAAILVCNVAYLCFTGLAATLGGDVLSSTPRWPCSHSTPVPHPGPQGLHTRPKLVESMMDLGNAVSEYLVGPHHHGGMPLNAAVFSSQSAGMPADCITAQLALQIELPRR